ncbi:MAG TPA: response regulator [Candidatus Aquilonibacter sp.]|nr:response regulator [Candidatus Aquilonibacter sp.]
MPEILVCDDDATTVKMLRGILKSGGFSVSTAADGEAALKALRKKKFDLVLLDIWMPKISGLDLLELLRDEPYIPKIVVLTSDQTSGTLLRTLRGRVFQFVAKPIDADRLLSLVSDALSAEPSTPPIEVLSATPGWVELLVPCDRLVVGRVQSFLAQLESDLPIELRESIGLAFRELLNNAIEWGGRLDPNQKVRISYIRTQRALLYRIDDPGPGFRPEELKHAAINNPEDDPMAHTQAREEKGLRPGGLGLLLTKSLVDELVYNEAHNEVVLIKYLGDATGSASSGA